MTRLSPLAALAACLRLYGGDRIAGLAPRIIEDLSAHHYVLTDCEGDHADAAYVGEVVNTHGENPAAALRMGLHACRLEAQDDAEAAVVALAEATARRRVRPAWLAATFAQEEEETTQPDNRGKGAL